MPSRNGATVIAFPGRSGPQKQTRMLVRNGYGVLLFDRRGEGASDGDPNIFGWGGDRDMHAAAAYLRSRPDVDGSRIGAIGLSVGGEMLGPRSRSLGCVQGDRLRGSERADRSATSSRTRACRTGSSTSRRRWFSLLPWRSSRTSSRRRASRSAAGQDRRRRPVFLIYGDARPGRHGGRADARASTPRPVSRRQIWRVPGGQARRAVSRPRPARVRAARRPGSSTTRRCERRRPADRKEHAMTTRRPPPAVRSWRRRSTLAVVPCGGIRRGRPGDRLRGVLRDDVGRPGPLVHTALAALHAAARRSPRIMLLERPGRAGLRP